MKIIKTEIQDVLLIKPTAFADERGYFFESYREENFLKSKILMPFVQDNVSRSIQGTLRGLHYQYKHAQGKLVSVIRGEVFDVAVDIRIGSPTFGKWVGEILSDTNHHQLYIPPGFAHGFYVLSDVADFYYKCTDYYLPGYDAGIMWNDQTININWPITNNLILSKKDSQLPFFNAIDKSKLPIYGAFE